MIDFRYHLVSIIGIFLALAVGIALGSGPLKGPIDDTITERLSQLQEDRDELRDQVAAQEATEQYYDDFLDGAAATLVGGGLADRRVVLVTAPGAEGGTAAELTDTLATAGATLSGTVALTDVFGDPQRSGEIDEVIARLVPPGVTFPDDATAGQRAAIVLARSVTAASPAPEAGADPGAAPPAAPVADADARALLEGLVGAGAVALDGEPWVPATVALVVAGPGPDTPGEEGDGSNDALVEVAAALADRSAAALVAGPVSAAETGGLIAAVRDDDAAAAAVATSDAADTAAGGVSSALGLARAVAGTVGHYGYGPGADDVVTETVPPAPES